LANPGELANLIWAQHRNRVRFEPIAHLLPGAPGAAPAVADAYAVQEQLVRLMIPSEGTPAGYKIGLTTAKMQRMCGIDEPVAGRILARRVLRSGAGVAAADFVRLGIESELCLVLSEDLPSGPQPHRLADVARAIGGAAAAFELIEDRGADYARLEACSLIADNSWNAGVVLGNVVSPRGAGLDVGALAGALMVDGKVVDSGSSADAMSHPYAVVLWLANHLRGYRQSLRAGDLVMTGSIATTRFAKAGEHYRFTLAGLEPVDLRIT